MLTTKNCFRISAVLSVLGTVVFVQQVVVDHQPSAAHAPSQSAGGAGTKSWDLANSRNVLAQQGGMGGMGGFGMGTTGLGAVEESKAEDTVEPLVVWKRPAVAPAWMIRGRESEQNLERVRNRLDATIEVAFKDKPLMEAVQEVLDKSGLEFEIRFENLGADEKPNLADEVSLETSASVRVLLTRLLEPHDFGYVVREGYIEIKPLDDLVPGAAVRTYDLTAVLPDNSQVKGVMEAITTSIEPDSWEAGDSTIAALGSVLIVTSDEGIHSEIERLLSSFSDARFSEPKLADPSMNEPREGAGAEEAIPTQEGATGNSESSQTPTEDSTGSKRDADQGAAKFFRNRSTLIKVDALRRQGFGGMGGMM